MHPRMVKITRFPLIAATALAIAGLTGCMAGTPDESNNANQSLENAAYLDTSLPMQQRVEDLVSRMTLEEKIAQMYNDAPAIERLNVPAYDYWNEALHGVARAGNATVFPQAIGLAAMWDKPLLHEIATAISDEGRAKHHYFKNEGVTSRYTGLTYWSPNINIFRDPRWGRGQETYGEDPFLTGELGVAFITGIQGDDDIYLKTAATAKHFAVHNGPEITRHSDNYVVSDKDLYETYLPAFEKAVVDADVEAVMCAYNRVNDLPACGSDMLLKEVLRGEYKFDGHVMSDCGAIADFYDPKAHDVVRAPAAAAAWAVTSGTDLNCGTGRLSSFANLGFAVQKGLIDEALIDQAVERLFMTRFRLGMFDPDEEVVYTDHDVSEVGNDAHLALTQKASERSLVLLKNDGVLPLKKEVSVAVIGPNADNQDVLLGNYNGQPINPVTVLDGIKRYLGENAVTSAPGSALIDDVYGHWQLLDDSVLFHKAENGERQPGLVAHYYTTETQPITDFTDTHTRVQITGEPKASEVLTRLALYPERSPVTNQLLDSFGMVASGELVPQKSGSYRFDGEGEITIDGKIVTDSIRLEAGQTHAFSVKKLFATDELTNTDHRMRARWQLSWVNTSEALLDNARKAARNADVIVMAVGISPRIEGEEMPVKLDGFNYGDRSSIDLPAEQTELIRAIHALDKPIVLVNFSGSAMALNWEQENLDAIVQAFYPGEATGTALARILWGEVSPSGRLPVTFYHNLDGFAAFDDYDMTNRTYRYFDGDVLYPFGFGLSYTTFSYSGLSAPSELKSGSDLTLSVTLNNDGDMASEQVTQLYVSMPDAPVKTPRVALKAFTRANVAAGASEKITINVPADELVYIDNQGNKVPYRGELQVYVGNGQPQFASDDEVIEAVITVR